MQPDTITPGGPQGLNRYSYVGNRPVNFNDPTGHYACGDGEEHDCDGKKRDLKIIGGPKCGGPGQEKCGDTPSDSGHKPPRRPPGNSDPLDELIWNEINHRFDPFTGWLPSDADYGNSEYPTDDYYALQAYEQAGYDLIQIAARNQDNPMTDYDWMNSDVPIDYIYSKGMGGQPPAHKFFLNYMKRDINNPSNYEANYLSALMGNHKQQLVEAKHLYYNHLISLHGSRQGAWDYLQMSIGVNGPDVID